MEGEGKIMISINKREVVAAAITSPLKEHEMPLSNLDILLPAEDFSIFLCYKNPKNEGKYTFPKVISILKEALSVSLISFYIFTGELSENGDSVLCNNRGVDFVEAFMDLNLKDIDFYNSHQSVDGILIPQRKHGILAIQVTELKCGGFVISCTFDHRVSDGHSANMFVLSLVEIAQSKSQLSSCVPSFDRSILSARNPPSFDLSILKTYIVPETLSPSGDSHSNGMKSTDQTEKLISRIYYMKADDIAELQLEANINNNKSCNNRNMKKTKLEAFSAFLWKLIANGEYASCKIGIVVEGRKKLSNENESKLWNLYFGNVLSIPFGEMNVEELEKKPINLVADSIEEFLKPAMNREHFLGLVDYIETHKPNKVLTKIYATEVGKDEAALVVSSGLHFPARKMDFGWGLPVFGSCHYSWKGKAGYVMPMQSVRGNGDWIVYMHLLERQLDLIEKCAAGGVLKPLTSEYLFME